MPNPNSSIRARGTSTGPGAFARLLRRFSIPRQWLLAYLLLIVVPACVILYGFYERNAAILKGEVVRTMQQTLKQAGNNLSYRLEHIEDISNAAFLNANLHQYLSVRDDDDLIGLQMDVIKELRELVTTVQTNSDVFRVRLFVNKSKLYASERVNFFPLDSLYDRPWYAGIIAGNGSIVWTGSYEEKFLEGGDMRIFSAARMLRDPDHYDLVSGVMMIDVKEQLLSDILSELQFSPGTQVYLVDEAGNVAYHQERDRIGSYVGSEMAELLKGASEGSGTVTLDHEVNEVMFATVGPSDWKLVAQGTESQLSQRAVQLTQISGITSLLQYIALFLVLPFVLLAIIVRGMNRRVNRVITAIRRDGVDSVNDLPAAKGDFLMLERTVDHLMLRVRTLVEEKYKAEIQEREAQLVALQAQINPHFLYNTLDTINWIAIGKGATDISQMIDGLAKYFRLSLNKGKLIVSVDDELRLAEVYLEIQRSRFPNTFDFRIECEPGLEEYRMPKLMLQPIVENALLHGIRKAKDRQGSIVVSARKEGGDLIFAVSDNGIGMDEDQTNRLLTSAPAETKPDGSGSSYGLFNVNERIKLYAGESYGVSIESRLGAGTTVTLRLKAEREE